jgi:nicotinamide-nucleotide amidase
MTRETASTSNKIALLATGDEITNGDILNSNAQIIAQKLFSEGIRIGTHMTVADNISEIEQAITYLLTQHRGLIITGGLGPTSDDITRFALSKAVNKPLVFDESVWNAICERFKILGYKGEPPEGNRQQALFPQGSTVIKNPSGTAAGCMLHSSEHWIFMLPGPPSECLPMVDEVILPELKTAKFQEIRFFNSWLLFGIGESLIASELDAAAKPFDCMTGYRLAFPYIEFKLYSNNERDFNALVKLVEKIIAPYLISDGKQTASAMLQKKLEQLDFTLSIHDTATGGLLESVIKTPQNCGRVNFTDKNAMVEIKGLVEYWEDKNSDQTDLEIIFKNSETIKKHVPYRGRGNRVKQYAVEYLCQQILNNLLLPSARKK